MPPLFPKPKSPQALLAGVFAFLLIAPSATHSEPLKSIDWVSPQDSGYSLLLQGVDQAHMQNWMTDRLHKNESLPQASARDLASDLLNEPGLNPQLKQKLEAAFPAETATLTDKTPQLMLMSEEVKKSVDALEPRLQAILEAKDHNNYGPLSLPRAQISLNSFYQTSNYRGLVRGENSQFDPALYSNSINMKLQGNSGSATWEFNLLGVNMPHSKSAYLFNPYNGTNPPPPIYATYNDLVVIGSGSILKIHLDPPGFSNVDIGVGSFYLTVDDLIFAAGAIPKKQPFFSNDVITPEESELVHESNLSFDGIFLRKTGQQGLWIFSKSELYVEPALSTQEPDRLVGKFDIRRLDIPGVLDDTDFWTSFAISEYPQYFSITPVHFQSDHDYSLGLNSQVPGGGYMSFEWAIANWSSHGPQPPSSPALISNDMDWQDQAWNLNLSKGLGLGSITLQGSQHGPRYVTGLRNGLTSDTSKSNQNGNYQDSSVDDPRPGNKGKVAYQTMASSFDWRSNNNRRLNLQGSLNLAWATLGLSAGFNTQIEPSGPWISSTRYLNNQGNNGHDWFDKVAGPNTYGYTPPGAPGPNPMPSYNAVTRGPAFYRGSAVGVDYKGASLSPAGQWNWDDLQSNGYLTTYEMILLSQTGVGDFNLREDSLKTVNDLKISLQSDFQAMFHSYLPYLLQGYSEIRDTDESIHLASYGDNQLLSQFINEYFMTAGLSPTINLLGYAGYETWLSKASAFPVDTIDTSYGVGLDFLLSKFLSGLTIGGRGKWLAHRDQNFAAKNFDGFSLNFGANIVY